MESNYVMEIVYQFRLLIIIFCDINIVTAVAGGEEGQIGLQKESQEFEKHENVELGLIKDANIEEGSQSVSGDPACLSKSENERVASVEPSPNRSGFCEENSKNTVQEKIQSGTEALGGPAGGHGESKDEAIVFAKPSPNTNEIAEESTLSGTTVSANSAINSTSEKESTRQLSWMKVSKNHREKFLKLQCCAKVKRINGVKVCFKEEFSIGTEVYIGLAKDGCEKAVKRFLKSTSKTLAENEKKILNAVNSEHVVNYWHCDDQSSKTFTYLFLDLHEETLNDYVERESQKSLADNAPVITQHILKGLNYLHNLKPESILHRDLKPSNILRNVKGGWLLADFDISRILPEGQTTLKSRKSRGTENWRAVESYRGDYKQQSDIQAVGMVCFYILTKGGYVFGREVFRLQNLLAGNPVGLDNCADFVAKDLISWLLELNPKDRPYAHKALKHPYLQRPDQQFGLLDRVGNQEKIKKREYSCDVVNEINTDPLLSNITWKSQMPPPVLNYLCTDRQRPKVTYKYGDKWSECLRLIRNTFQHWNDGTHSNIGTMDIGNPQDFFLKVFPTLPVVVHRAIRSKEDWKKRKDLEQFF